MSTPQPSAEQVTLNTLRDWAERTITVTAAAERFTHAAGCRSAARDVLAILDMNGRPPHEPVIFRAPGDEP